MMNSEPTRVLAIDPGTKVMGVAVLVGRALIYHDIKTIERGQSPLETLEQGRGIVADLIEGFQPNVLVIEQMFVRNNRHVALLNVLADEIVALARERNLRVLTFAPSTVKKAVTGHGWSSKHEVARAVCRRYPRLRAYLNWDVKWKESLHQNMFDAVALGMMIVS